jgi:hypothetical protein
MEFIKDGFSLLPPLASAVGYLATNGALNGI